MIYLTTDQYKIYYKSNDNLLSEHRSHSVFPPAGIIVVLGFAQHTFGEPFPTQFINRLIKHNVGVLYFCDILPPNPVIDDHIVYVAARSWAFFLYNVFKNPQVFKAVFGVGSVGKRYASAFKEYNVSFVTPGIQIDSLVKQSLQDAIEVQTQKVMLFDTVSYCGDRGLGDILMTTIPIKYLTEREGWTVDYLVRPTGAKLLINNPYIRRIFIRNRLPFPDVSNYSHHFILARSLEDYRITFNQRNRIDVICDLLRVDPNNIGDFTPVLVLTDKEKEFGKSLLHKTKRTVVVNLHSTCSVSRSYPTEYWYKLLKKLSSRFNVILVGVYEYDSQDLKITNLCGSLTLRQLASVCYNADCTLTTDTGVTWISLSFRKPTFVLFSTIDPMWRISRHSNAGHLISNIACCPCNDYQYVRDQYLFNSCMRDTRVGKFPRCMRELSPTLVYKSFLRFLKNQRFSI